MDEIYQTFLEGPSILEKAYKISRKALEKVGKFIKIPPEIIDLIQMFTWDYYFIEKFQDQNKALYLPNHVNNFPFWIFHKSN